MNPARVAILAGGRSNEATVSRSSAAEVTKALKLSYTNVEQFELDDTLTRALLAFRPDVVFPVLHGPPGEDGTVQGYLEILGFPYVGSGVHASATAMDKSLAKAVFRRVGLPVCQDRVFAAGTAVADACRETLAALGDRVVVKPLRQGSAIGVTPVMNGGDLTRPFETAFALGDGVLVEPFVLGMEVTVGVLDLHGQSARAFPTIEVRTPRGTWYDFAHRYTVGQSEHVIPAGVSVRCQNRLQEIAVAAHTALGCVDLSRADFIVTDAEDIVLLEVNSLPGMTPTSLYPDGARAQGLAFDALMDALVRSGLGGRADRARWGRGGGSVRRTRSSRPWALDHAPSLARDGPAHRTSATKELVAIETLVFRRKTSDQAIRLNTCSRPDAGAAVTVGTRHHPAVEVCCA